MAAEDDNLGRWQQPGEPRYAVAARRSRWDHRDWLTLLDTPATVAVLTDA